jgi:hypothetical protein
VFARHAPPHARRRKQRRVASRFSRSSPVVPVRSCTRCTAW